MSEYNITIKEEVVDPSYRDTHEHNIAPETGPNYEVSTEFVSVKIEKEDCNSPTIRQIKEEPLDLTPERPPDSPQFPDSTTDVSVKAEDCVEVQLFVEYDSEDRDNQVQGNEQPTEVSESITALYEEKTKLNEKKKQFIMVDGKFSCKLCQKMYMTKASIVRHLLQHTEEDFITPPNPPEIYKCDKCGKTFKCKSNLAQHTYIHIDEKQFKCDLCQRSFTLKSNLIRHQGKSQCSLDERRTCNICNQTFDKESQLRGHMRKHNIDRPYSCTQCSVSFKYKSTLVRHIQMHNGEVKLHSCRICGKTFTQYGLIKPHMRMHTGEKPYACPICSKQFSHKHNMLRHQARHDKVVNLNCPVCDKKFPKESRLKYHMRTHMDVKCFACGICPKKFSHRQNVIRHYSRKHPDSIYQSTETDASVALKLWNEVKNNERPFPDKDIKRNVVKKNKDRNEVDSENESTSENGIEEEVEEILPDVKKTEIAFEVVNVKVESESEGESSE